MHRRVRNRGLLALVLVVATASFRDCHCDGSGEYWDVLRTVFGPYERASWSYDAAGRLTEHARFSRGRPTRERLDERQRYAYDVDGRLVSQVEEEEAQMGGMSSTARVFAYDARGRLSEESYATGWQDDAATTLTPRHRLVYHYDVQNRLVSLGCDGCGDAFFGYFDGTVAYSERTPPPDGEVDPPDGELDHWRDYAYDPSGNLVHEVAYCRGTVAAEIERTYDASGTLRFESRRPLYESPTFSHLRSSAFVDRCGGWAFDADGREVLVETDAECDGPVERRAESTYDDVAHQRHRAVSMRTCEVGAVCDPFAAPMQLVTETFNADGRVIVREVDGYDPDMYTGSSNGVADGIVDERMDFAYDAAGREVYQAHDHPIGEPFEYSETRVYDGAGRLISFELDGSNSYYDTGADGVVDAYTHRQYDAEGRLLLDEQGYGESLYYRQTCSFDASTEAMACATDEDGDGEVDLRTAARWDSASHTRTFDEDGFEANLGHCLSPLGYLPDGVIDRRTTETYDADGNLVAELVEGMHDIKVGEVWCYEDGACDDGGDEHTWYHCEP